MSFPALHAQKKRSIGCRATSSERSYNSKKALPLTGTEHPSISMRIWTALFLPPKSVIWLPDGCVARLPGISWLRRQADGTRWIFRLLKSSEPPSSFARPLLTWNRLRQRKQTTAIILSRSSTTSILKTPRSVFYMPTLSG